MPLSVAPTRASLHRTVARVKSQWGRYMAERCERQATLLQLEGVRARKSSRLAPSVLAWGAPTPTYNTTVVRGGRGWGVSGESVSKDGQGAYRCVVYAVISLTKKYRVGTRCV